MANAPSTARRVCEAHVPRNDSMVEHVAFAWQVRYSLRRRGSRSVAALAARTSAEQDLSRKTVPAPKNLVAQFGSGAHQNDWTRGDSQAKFPEGKIHHHQIRLVCPSRGVCACQLVLVRLQYCAWNRSVYSVSLRL